ncbi:hypothetical protein NDN16_10525 [Aureimonas altamirensis]|uniref:hypothetical protein n=1 Tax=Aureimonas altamirensis TaxID=370622 RepID=UPI00203677EA|nr:hypothetical protein [Aureimonas altamirensis]MCM2504106.1 hypothetical protein [Aureimonas altamirensis]
MRKRTTSNDITGRDGYIVTQALIYAIAHIQNLPEEDQEWANMRDMCRLVRASTSPFIPQFMLSVKNHTGTLPNLWPEEEGDLSASELTARDEFQAELAAFEERMNLLSKGAYALMTTNDGTAQVMGDDGRGRLDAYLLPAG